LFLEAANVEEKIFCAFHRRCQKEKNNKSKEETEKQQIKIQFVQL
jgi:hypothetical protein